MSYNIVTDPLHQLLGSLKGVKGGHGKWTALCPAHDDTHRSLSVRRGHDGTVLVYCHAGCATDRVAAACNLTLADLCSPRDTSPCATPGVSRGGTRRVAATYDYRDEQGQLLYQVVRFDPKGFRQRRPDGRGDWTWKVAGVRRVPYRLPELLAADPAEPVFVVEGEKDADRLAAEGLVATTNAGGAGRWPAAFAPFFRGRVVHVLPDNDDPGRQHAAAVAAALHGVAREVRVVGLLGLPPKGDVSDFLARGHSGERLKGYAAAAPLWTPPACQPPGGTRADDALWETVADVPARAVHWLWPGWLPRGKLAVFDGDPGLGKSLVTLDLAARLTTGRDFPDGTPGTAGPVLLANCEDGVADTIRPRLERLGADLARVHVFEGPPCDGGRLLPALPRDFARLEAAVRRLGAALVVIDPVMAFLDETVCTGNDQSVRSALSPLVRLAEDTSCAILLVRHLNKSGGAKAIYRGGGSIGITGACRVAWLVGKHPHDDRQRVLAQVKNNLDATQPSLTYQVLRDESGGPQLAWLGHEELGADHLVGGGPAEEPATEVERACEALRDALKAGPRKGREVRHELGLAGLRSRTVYRAFQELGGQSRRLGGVGSEAEWYLPEAPGASAQGEQAAPPERRRPYQRGPQDGPYFEGR